MSFKELSPQNNVDFMSQCQTTRHVTGDAKADVFPRNETSRKIDKLRSKTLTE